MPPISLLIKPASSSCNLKCTYCFYHDLAEKRSVANYGMMSLDLLEHIVQKALTYADHTCTFAFQGGEPMLSGIDFYRQLVAFQQKYNTKKVTIHNTIQTNGVLMDESWARFLSEHQFLVGLSLDGPQEIHNANRIDAHGRGSFKQVMKCVRWFNHYHIPYNILCVVTRYTARHVDKVYSFFRKEGFNHLQFIPCINPIYEIGQASHTLQPDDLAFFLQRLFDRWYEDLEQGITNSIRYFDNLIRILAGYPPELCGIMGGCACQFVIEADGSVYPCDFYVMDMWRLGNIREQDWDTLRRDHRAQQFVERSKSLESKCYTCKWTSLCRGGCTRYRDSMGEHSLSTNPYCEAYQTFYDYSASRLQYLAELIRPNSRVFRA